MISIILEMICNEAEISNPKLLITREKGQKVYSALATHLEGIDLSTPPIKIVFPENQLMDVSFADEVVVHMGEELVNGTYGEDQGLILQGLGEDSLENLMAVVKLRKLKIAFLVIKPSGEWDCVGQLEQNLRDTLNLLFTQGRLTAPDLVKQLGLAVNTASTRLKRLYDLHLVKRDFEITDNGLQYIYQFWPMEEPRHD